MKKFIKNLFIFLLTTFLFVSCDKWLDVKPADRVVEENVFNSEAGFLSAINGVYSELLHTDLYGLALGSEFIEILAQQYNIRNTNVNYIDVSNYSYTSSYPKQRLERIWDKSFQVILNCNMIIENIQDNSEFISSTFHDLILGESLALRAFFHFDMLRLFGPVYSNSAEQLSIPYVIKPSVSAFDLLSANDIAQLILNDLNQAEELLKASDPIIQNGPQNFIEEDVENNDRFRTLRFNYFAVKALKARVYLYIGDKENALKYASKVIDEVTTKSYFPFTPHTEVLSNITNPDLVFSTEILFGMFNTGRNNIFQNYFNPDAASEANLLIPRPGNIALLFSGEENDYRNFPIWKNSNLEANAVYTMKFRSGEDPTAFKNNVMSLIRLSEMYLIAAESEQDEEKAYTYLNTLRNSRGLSNISSNINEHLRNEYTKEFYGEGQLFFFYKRNDIPSIRSGITNNNITMTVARYVPLLPDSESKFRN